MEPSQTLIVEPKTSIEESTLKSKRYNVALIILSCIGFSLMCIAFFFHQKLTSLDGWFGKYYLHNETEVWELIAIVWSICFSYYYLINFNLFKTNDYYNNNPKKLTTDIKRSTAILIFLVIICVGIPGISIYCLIYLKDSWSHLLWAAALSIVFYFLDFYLSYKHASETERKEYRIIHWLANVPVVFTYIIFFSWISFQDNCPSGWEQFASGIVATQFIIINIIFIVTQFGVITRIYRQDN